MVLLEQCTNEIAVIVKINVMGQQLQNKCGFHDSFFSVRMRIPTIPKKWSGLGRPCRPVCDGLV